MIRTKRAAIERAGAPDVERAFQRWLTTVRRGGWPANAFGRVMASALDAERVEASVSDAAFRWLQGDPDTLTKAEMQDLHLEKVTPANRNAFGRELLLSAVKFLPAADVHGLVLLMDEVETLTQVRGKALLRILAAMRVLLDSTAGVSGGVPLCGIFAATPEVREEFSRYPALKQRLAVSGASFDEGNDLATQLPLDKVGRQGALLEEVGRKLIDVGRVATGHAFDGELQAENARRLAAVASERSLDIDARRLFIKTWVNLLNLQSTAGERQIDPDELERRYRGSFKVLENSDSGDYEP